MNADRILAKTFADHEHLAPDADTAWAAIADRLDSRRSPRRALAVVSSAAAVVVLGAGGTVLLRDSPDAAPAATSATPTATSATPTATSATPTATVPADARPTFSIGAGWLPPRAVAVSGRTGSSERIVYLAGRLELSLTFDPGESLSAPPTRGVTVNGQPAVESSEPGKYRLAFRVPGRGVAEVILKDPSRPTAELTSIGRRAAAAMRFDRADPVPVPFLLTYRPASFGYRIASWGDIYGSYYWLGRPGAPVDEHPLITVVPREGAWQDSEDSKGRGPAVAGRPVQDHRTWVVRDDQALTLWVESLWPGRSFYLNGYGVSLEELYRVADGIRRA